VREHTRLAGKSRKPWAASILASRFIDLIRKITKAVGDVYLSPTTLFFSDLCLKISYGSRASDLKKGIVQPWARSNDL
jgi:hypothetical protein